MPIQTKKDWEPWHAEREAFSKRATEGLTKDIEALKDHIKKLNAICPKDKEGFPVSEAEQYLHQLFLDYQRALSYLQRLR